MKRTTTTYRPLHLCLVLLLCLLQAVSGEALYAQNQSRAASKRQHRLPPDSLNRQRTLTATDSLRPFRPQGRDSLSTLRAEKRDSLSLADSLAAENRRKMLELTTPQAIQSEPLPTDSLNWALNRKQWIPNPTKATWLALVFPGGGQIYNRKYWKLPIFYGGFAGCAYALSWNNKMYKDYMNAYKDAANDRWDSTNITDLLPPGYLNRVSKTQLTETLRKRKDTYRRYRDLSIFAFIGVYLLSVVDAYVDAELSNFDITPELSMRVEPALIDMKSGSSYSSQKSVGLQCSFRF